MSLTSTLTANLGVFLQFLMPDVCILMQLNRCVRQQILKYLQGLQQEVAQKFKLKYSMLFDNVRAKCRFYRVPTAEHTVKTQQNALIRQLISVDISASVRTSVKKKVSYILSYSYRCLSNMLKQLFWEIQFDVVDGSHTVWLYMEQTRNHYIQNKTPLVQGILPVKPGDTVQVEVPILTLFGISSLQHLKFYPAAEQPYVDRPCRVEGLFEWTLHKYFEHPVQFELEDIIGCYPSHLQVEEIRCSGVGFYNYKIQMLCLREGYLPNLMGHAIRIVSRQGKIEVRTIKKGSYDQSKRTLQLRVGDHLIIYFTPNQ